MHAPCSVSHRLGVSVSCSNLGAQIGAGLSSTLRVATGSSASKSLKDFAAAPGREPMHGAANHPIPRNVASPRSRNQVRFSCVISDSFYCARSSVASRRLKSDIVGSLSDKNRNRFPLSSEYATTQPSPVTCLK
jgi:hypothetical protein